MPPANSAAPTWVTQAQLPQMKQNHVSCQVAGGSAPWCRTPFLPVPLPFPHNAQAPRGQRREQQQQVTY